MVQKPRKTNSKFMLLSAIGIIMIVNSHCDRPLNILNSFIPHHSFFVPLFVFISGYFNKVDDTTKLGQYIRKKENSLLLPYIIISFVTFWLELAVKWFKTGVIPSLTLEDCFVPFIELFTKGCPVDISGPIWFIPALFCVLLFYAVIKKLFCRFWNSYVAFGVFCALNMVVVWIAKFIGAPFLLLLPMKTLFFLPFIEMGIIYREKIEPRISGLDVNWK